MTSDDLIARWSCDFQKKASKFRIACEKHPNHSFGQSAPMAPEQSDSREKAVLQIRPESGLAGISADGSPALSEIISRSIVHIQTSKSLATRHWIGKHELCGPDYQLVCVWAEELRLAPEHVLELLLKAAFGGCTSIIDGRFKQLFVSGSVLPVCGLPPIKGLSVEVLSLQYREQVSRLDLSAVPNLRRLECWNNKMTELELSPVSKLTVLKCGGNYLTELDLRPVPNLRTLYCYSNHLTELDVSAVPELTNLNCGANKIKDLDLSSVPKLKILSCGGNQLTKLDLSVIPNIVDLACGYNHLSNIDLSVVAGLKELVCASNELNQLDVSSLKNLELLNCESNNLTALDLSENSNLVTLWCGGNSLSGLEIRHLKNLEDFRSEIPPTITLEELSK